MILIMRGSPITSLLVDLYLPLWFLIMTGYFVVIVLLWISCFHLPKEAFHHNCPARGSPIIPHDAPYERLPILTVLLDRSHIMRILLEVDFSIRVKIINISLLTCI